MCRYLIGEPLLRVYDPRVQICLLLLPKLIFLLLPLWVLGLLFLEDAQPLRLSKDHPLVVHAQEEHFGPLKRQKFKL